MTELWPFIIVGALAIAAAVMMLLSDNAVHSALFLIMVMLCIAFMFLLLNAAFLALIQITVYAGAIMVLFLFVIMLLGNEKLKGSAKPDPTNSRRFRWFVPLAFALSLGLLFSFGFVVINAQDGAQSVPAPLPMLRVLNAWADETPLDVYVGETQTADDLLRGEATEWQSVSDAGVQVRVVSSVDPAAEAVLDLTAARGQNVAVVAHGLDAAPVLVQTPHDVSSVFPPSQARLQFLNLSTALPAVQIQERTVAFVDRTTPLVPSVAQGQLSEPVQHTPMTASFSVVNPDNPAESLYNLNDYEFRANQSDLFILTDQRAADGSVRPVLVPFASSALAPFGTPQQMGYSLLTTFLLPFQMIGLLLLAALIGVIVLSQRLARPRTRSLGRRVVSRPLTSVIAAQVGHDVTATDAPRLPDSADTAGAGD